MTKLEEKRGLALCLMYGCILMFGQMALNVLDRAIVKDIAVRDVSITLLRESCSYMVMRWLALTGLVTLGSIVPYICVKRYFREKPPPPIQGPMP